MRVCRHSTISNLVVIRCKSKSGFLVSTLLSADELATFTRLSRMYYEVYYVVEVDFAKPVGKDTSRSRATARVVMKEAFGRL